MSGPETAENNLGYCAGRVGRMASEVIPMVQVARSVAGPSAAGPAGAYSG